MVLQQKHHCYNSSEEQQSQIPSSQPLFPRPHTSADVAVIDACRRTLGFTKIPYDDMETSDSLCLLVKQYLKEEMEIDAVSVELLGPLSAVRPICRRPRTERPVEVTFHTREERDLVISSTAPLFRKGDASKIGRVYVKFPGPWFPLKNHLQRQVDRLRLLKQNGRQVWHAQLRYSDDADGISVYVKNIIANDPWIPYKKALTRYADKPELFPPSSSSSS